MAKLAGSFWVESTELHYASDAGDEYSFQGTYDSTKTPTGALPGCIWLEDRGAGVYNLYYIGEDIKAYYINQVLVGVTGASAFEGSLWIEGIYVHWIGSADKEYYGHLDNAHGDATHTDIGHDDDHGDSHSDQAHDDVYIDQAHEDVEHGDSGSSYHNDDHGDDHADDETNNYHSDWHTDEHGDDHTDNPHTDFNHVDAHGDDGHGDSHSDDHGDTTHSDAGGGHTDTPHGDQPVEIGF